MPRTDRPQCLEGKTVKVRTGHGTLYVTVNWHPETGLPFEVFATLGKAGGCESAHLEALTRLISVVLQHGIHPTEVISQLRQVTCHPYGMGGDIENTSPADAIAHVLEGSYDGDKEDDEEAVTSRG